MNFSVTLKEVLEALDVFMVIKRGCPYCDYAAKLLRDRKINFTEFDHEKYKQLDRDVTKANNNYPTYPKIYFNKQFIEGYSGLCEYFKKNDSLNRNREL